MLTGLKRLFAQTAATAAAARAPLAVAHWAEERQYMLRAVRDSEGFVLEGRSSGVPWRLEWGPAQRPYVQGNELRLRCEPGLPAHVQALVLDCTLQEQLESAVFDQYVEGAQTCIDTQTPPEMRWLVMFPKLSATDLGLLRERFAVVGPQKQWLMQWLDGPLRTALDVAQRPTGSPLVLMLGRGRLSLRTALANPEPALLEGWIRLFETALREARRVDSQNTELDAPSTQPSLWSQSSLAPGKESALPSHAA